jgi:hypothetical protein
VFFICGETKKTCIQMMPTLDWLERSSFETLPSIGVSELNLVSSFKRTEVCLIAEERYFECLL